MTKYISILFYLFSVCIQCFTQTYEINHDKLSVNDNLLNYELSILYPVIKNPYDEGQASFNVRNKFLMDSKIDTFKNVLSELDSGNIINGQKSYYEISDSVFYADERLISVLYYENFYFSGAAHPANSNFSLNYDLKLGKTLQLNDLFYGNYLNIISEICRNEISKNFGMDKPDEWIIRGTKPTENNFEVFNITKTNITITFPTYQVASYVAGSSTVEINYIDIKDYIKPGCILNKFIH
jgi:hypothetical protein